MSIMDEITSYLIERLMSHFIWDTLCLSESISEQPHIRCHPILIVQPLNEWQPRPVAVLPRVGELLVDVCRALEHERADLSIHGEEAEVHGARDYTGDAGALLNLGIIT